MKHFGEKGFKKAARAAVHYAVKTGKLIKPETCEKCGRDLNVTFHHQFGYEKNDYLRGWWLCGKCHRTEEKSENPEQLLLFPEPLFINGFFWDDTGCVYAR